MARKRKTEDDFEIQSSTDEVSMVTEIRAEAESPSPEELGGDLPIMTLRNMLMFTSIVMPVTVGRQSTLKLVRSALKNKQHIIIATQKVAEVEELIKQKTAEHPELAGTNTAFCWISPDDFSTFYVYLPADPRAAFLTDLGLPFPESVKKMASSDSEFSITVSRENADQLSDIDMMVVYGDESLLSALQKDKLMSQIPAIKNGAVVLLDSTSALAAATTPSILSIPDQIDDYLALLVEAHGKIK